MSAAAADSLARRAPSRREVCEGLAGALRRAFASAKAQARAGGTTVKAAEKQRAAENAASLAAIVGYLRESDEVLEEILRLAGRADVIDRLHRERAFDDALAGIDALRAALGREAAGGAGR